MTFFGDFEDDDAFDREPLDVEQLEIKLAQLRRLHGTRDREFADHLIAWLRRQGHLT